MRAFRLAPILMFLAVTLLDNWSPVWALSCKELFVLATPRVVGDWTAEGFSPSVATAASGFSIHVSSPKPYTYREDVDLAHGAPVFLIGGINSSDKILHMRTLTGVTLDVLTERAKPNAPEFRGHWGRSDNDDLLFAGLDKVSTRRSGEGQIAANENMRDVLLKDNDLVLSKGLNHQRVAEPLLSMMADFEAEIQNPNSRRVSTQGAKAKMNFVFNGKSYVVVATSMGALFGLAPGARVNSGWVGQGVQGSIFNDSIFADWYFSIIDPVTQKVLNGDALTPHLIYRYGFYQSGPYRMDPLSIIHFFDLK